MLTQADAGGDLTGSGWESCADSAAEVLHRGKKLLLIQFAWRSIIDIVNFPDFSEILVEGFPVGGFPPCLFSPGFRSPQTGILYLEKLGTVGKFT